MQDAFKKAVLVVALANLSYFGVEFAAALKIGSVSLLADSVDFLEDASVNLLIFFAASWTLARRARVGMGLAALILVPVAVTLWSVWRQVMGQEVPHAAGLSVVGFGALIVNSSCAFLLARYRKQGGSLMRAAFLSARNDAAANIAIIITGFVTALYPSVWPDIIVGLCIAGLNADAAHEVYETARKEYNEAAHRA